MIQFLFATSPLITLFLTAIIALGICHNHKLALNTGFIGMGIALLLNTLLLLFFPDPVRYNAFYISKGSIWLVEILLIGLGIIYISIDQNLKNSQNKEIIPVCYLMFTAGAIGIFFTENLLVFTAFFMLTAASLAAMFFFGPYRKKIHSLNEYLFVNFFSGNVLIITNIITFYYYKTLELSELAILFPTQPLGVQTTIFIGYLLGIGSICGLIPFANWHLNDYFLESNPINLRLICSIFLPLCGIILIRILAIAPYGEKTFANILFVVGTIGFILGTVQTLLEIFGKNKIGSRSLPKIIGFFSVMEFNVFLIVGALFRLSAIENNTIIITASLYFLILAVFGKSLLIEAVSPVLDHSDSWELQDLGGYNRFYPKFILFLIVIPILYAMPGLMGYLFLNNMLEATVYHQIEEPIQGAQLWFILVLVVILIIVLFILIATILNEIYFGKSTQTQVDVIPKMPTIYYYAPILILLAYFIFTLLFSGMIPFSNQILENLSQTFFLK